MSVQVKQIGKGRWRIFTGNMEGGPVLHWTRKHLVMVNDSGLDSGRSGLIRAFEITAWKREYDDHAELEVQELYSYKEPPKVEKPERPRKE